ncbi:hypothetical protein [Catalinimonas niigatensis]|uniref:hypothetical protein n=1 Tax=Catalinimonas niigatensis TaxID=1397264 RepID=UPI0026669122|nr:hypothetical protein [Catalinimonas niigatensis]WPP49287.1 hypothetical protein PZB72_21700 [Catalinimonas niigatensis]
MKNQSKIEELLADLLKSNDRQEGRLTNVENGIEGLRKDMNNNFTHLDMNFKMMLKLFEQMNEKFDKVIDFESKFKQLEERVKSLENRVQ